METVLYKKQTIFWDKEGSQNYKEVFTSLNASRVFAVCSESAVERYGKQFFSGSQMEVTWFSHFASNPVYEDIKEGVEQFHKEKYDAVVSIGGGSAIDVAKAILAFSGMDASKDYMEQEITESGIVHLAVPTTAGTGSESTHFAVVYVNGEKKSISHESLLPDYALLEPAYLESLPVYQKKSTVLDALCQAVESYWSVNSTEESKGYAKQAINTLMAKISAYIDGDDTANADIIQAANLAGRAIDITQTTAAHALSYKLTSLYGIPHGHAVAVCLPFVWEVFLTNLEQCIDKRGKNYLLSVMRDLQEFFGVDSTEHAILLFHALLDELEINLDAFELSGNLELLTDSVNVQRLGNFPIELSRQDLQQIYQQAFERVKGPKAEYRMISEVSRRFRSLRKKKFKSQKKMLALSLQTADPARKMEAVWMFHKCLEYRMEHPENETVMDLWQKRDSIMGMLAGYVRQAEDVFDDMKQVKEQLKQLDEAYGSSGSERFAGEICSVIPMDKKKMYLYVRQAYMYDIMDQKEPEILQELFGISDLSLIKSILDGLLYQFGLHEYHYITPEGEEALQSMAANASLPEGMQKDGVPGYLKEVFRERAEEEWQYDIICWHHISRRGNEGEVSETDNSTMSGKTAPVSAETSKKPASKKGGIKKFLRGIKRNVMDDTEHPLIKEMFRRLLNFKRRVTYTLRFKYKFPVDDKIVLFESYSGDHYNCNPRGIYEAMIKDERYLDYTFVWAFKEPEKYEFLKNNLSTIVVKSMSKRHHRYCASAKYIVSNLLLRPHITLKKEQTYIQTWHGKPIKTIGCGKRFETDPRRRLKDTYRHFTQNGKRITKLLSPSEAFTPIMGEAFNFTKLKKNDCIVETGYPRNDELFRYTDADIARIKQYLGVAPDKKVILYAPTWRELFSNYLEKENIDVALRVSDSIDFARLEKELGEEYVIIFRAHHMDAKAMDISRYGDFIIDATTYENVNDLYIISDLMISDYSGTIFDFGILKRPMVFYMFDRELYTTKLQGVNVDLDEFPGIFVEKEEELAPAIKKQFAEFRYDEKYEKFNQKYNQYEDGHCGQRVIDKCMPDNVVKKTPTTRAAKNYIKTRIGFISMPLKKFKFNVIGFLREKGIIRDENTRNLLQLKNKYQGQRCFLIGNGPSLKAEDLDMIADEISFGCNMVYKMFDRTKWRPTYHFIVDVIYTKNMHQEIKSHVESPLITHNVSYNCMKIKPDNVTYANLVSQDEYEIRGNMLAYYVSAKATVMTFMIEMAIYMGIKEIYLLGTDCTNSFTSGHFGEEYVASDLDRVNLARQRRVLNNPNLTLEELGEYRRERSIMAYEKIAEYAKECGVKIYNATRGGALEVFPRKQLEDVLDRK